MTTNQQTGWIKTYRKIMESDIWQNPVGLKIWMWCLLKASHEDKVILINRIKVTLKPGEFVFGRITASEELNQAPSTIRNWITFLKKDSYLDIRSNNKYSIITIKKWGEYQNVDINLENQIKTGGKPNNTNKNVKNDKNINNRAMPSVDNFGGKVEKPLPRGMSDMATTLQISLEKMKTAKPARDVPDWMRHALEVADKLKIDWNNPELVKDNIKARWFSLFKRKPWGELQGAYSFCYDYPNKPDSAGLVKLFFWKTGHKHLSPAP